jgi:hypothetical protein
MMVRGGALQNIQHGEHNAAPYPLALRFKNHR